MFVRIQYLTRDGAGDPTFDSYVAAMGECTIDEAILQLLRDGFTRFNTERTPCDEEECIMPGAIMSVTPCDERGYTKHDYAEVQRKSKERQ
jgi:hypothetical protein